MKHLANICTTFRLYVVCTEREYMCGCNTKVDESICFFVGCFEKNIIWKCCVPFHTCAADLYGFPRNDLFILLKKTFGLYKRFLLKKICFFNYKAKFNRSRWTFQKPLFHDISYFCWKTKELVAIINLTNFVTLNNSLSFYYMKECEPRGVENFY